MTWVRKTPGTADEIVSNNLYIKGPRPWVDVRGWGAVGDGVADDGPAWNAARAALPSSGGIVFVPPGSYNLVTAFTFGGQTNVLVLIAAGVTLLGSALPAATGTNAILNLTSRRLTADSLTIAGPTIDFIVAAGNASIGTVGDFDFLLKRWNVPKVEVKFDSVLFWDPISLPGNPNADLHAVPRQYVDSLNRVTSPVTVVNTLTETDLYNFQVPGGTLSTDRVLHLLAVCDSLNNTGAGVNYTVRAYYGGVKIFDSGAVAVVQRALRGSHLIDVHLLAQGATGAQVARARWRGQSSGISDASLGLSDTSEGFSRFAVRNAIGVDSTAAQALRLTVQMSVANAAIDFRLLNAHLYRSR